MNCEMVVRSTGTKHNGFMNVMPCRTPEGPSPERIQAKPVDQYNIIQQLAEWFSQ